MIFRVVAQTSVKFSVRLRFASNMSEFLIDREEYSFLKDLGLRAVNAGVYDGQWKANGEVSNIFQNLI